MLDSPLISVIIPMFNAEEFIIDCLESVSNQLYKNLEIIVVDDGSVDNSATLVNEYRETTDKRVTLITQKNAGVSQARNKGMDIATGQYILFVDSDDEIEAEMIQTMINYQTEDNYVWCGMENIYRNGKRVIQCYGNNVDYYVFENKELANMFTSLQFSPPVNKLYDAKIIRQHNLRFANAINLHEDMLFNLQYLQSLKDIKGIYINQPFYKYIHRNQQSLTRSVNDNQWDINDYIFRQIESYFLYKCGLENNDLKRYYMYCYKTQRQVACLECENKRLGAQVRWLKYRLLSDSYRYYLSAFSYKENASVGILDYIDYFLLEKRFIITNILIRRIISLIRTNYF